MLVEKNRSCSYTSKYVCDRCKKGISRKEKNLYSIYVRYIDGNPSKQWDLCDRCFNALQRGIKAGGK